MTNDAELVRRLELYQNTGKADYLIDVAKFAMWGFIERQVRQGVCW